MGDKSSATVAAPVTAGTSKGTAEGTTDRTAGLALGALGVLAFSMSLPATRTAVQELDSWFVAFGRAVGAGLLAWGYLRATGAPRPSRAQWRRLAVVALGVVVGFPLFTSLALTAQTAAHGAVVVALLPAITAVFAVLRAGERPPRAFWLAASAGLVAVVGFLAAGGTVRGSLELADLYLLVAVVLCGLGYAEGGALARELGGARTICWALIVALPVTVPVTALAAVVHPPHASATAWAGFGYVTVISMFLGFFAWYTGLARGGVAQVGQVQLAQPVLTLLWSALLLGEPVGPAAIVAALAVLVCVVLTQRTRAAVTVRPAAASAI
ncbi:DMT family transporter [Catellatospora tritici]|uniref:DMT family transporter n=1 Tax=Catellatospora tritici TaxID=2851566 RepID=UPI001C2D5BD1|nr:DMT family transporter [Catellatospora tritici]MBV1855305.1 DMT family transporter [Catellatospora tritici]